MAPPVAFVLKGYPRLSETFIAQEIRALEQRGLDIRIYSMRRPTDPAAHPVHREIAAPIVYLPEYLHQEPSRVWRGLCASRHLAGWRAALRAFAADLRRDPTRNRLRRFGQAMVLAAELPDAVGRLHAHFLHTPASVTRYAALLLGLPWSASAHAKDIWTTPAWELASKLAECRWLATCTAANARYLAALAPVPERVELIYHGLDLRRFPSFPIRRPPRDGSGAEPVVLLSVGRAVEKKGYAGLIEALALLPTGLNWRFVHIGGGPLLAQLRQQAARRGLAGRIDWRGPLPQEAVLAAYRSADAFVLACRIASDGDRDGLPNVLMEAHSQGLACLSTEVSAIPELIIDGKTGLLVPADDARALAAVLVRLIRDPDCRLRLGAAAMQRLHQGFAMEPGIDRLAQLFGIGQGCGSPSTPR